MNNTIRALIVDLERCAKQNESDAKSSAWITHSMDAAQARAVAAEQRRIIGRLKRALRLCEMGEVRPQLNAVKSEFGATIWTDGKPIVE